jgi:hypothetical protein
VTARRCVVAMLRTAAAVLRAPHLVRTRQTGTPWQAQDRVDKMAEMTGGCLCGQVSYMANSDPIFVGVCHCTHCQKQSGTAFSVLVGIPKSAMSIEGRLKTFHDTCDSGQPVERNFCPECGSPIFSDLAVMPGLTFIKAGTLDDTSWLEPKIHFYCNSAERWTPIPEGSQKFANPA